MKLEKRLTSAGESVTAKALGAMRPRTPTRRCRSISRVNRRPISTGWRLLRNGLANVPSTRRSSRSSNCWSPMVPQRLPVRCAREGFGRRLTWSPRRESGGGRTGAPPATTVVRSPGRVAELADAQDSGSCVRKDVGVQVPPRPPPPPTDQPPTTHKPASRYRPTGADRTPDRYWSPQRESPRRAMSSEARLITKSTPVSMAVLRAATAWRVASEPWPARTRAWA